MGAPQEIQIPVLTKWWVVLLSHPGIEYHERENPKIYIGIKCSTKPFSLEPDAKHPLIAIIVKVRRYQSVDSTADENSFQKE